MLSIAQITQRENEIKREDSFIYNATLSGNAVVSGFLGIGTSADPRAALDVNGEIVGLTMGTHTFNPSWPFAGSPYLIQIYPKQRQGCYVWIQHGGVGGNNQGPNDEIGHAAWAGYVWMELTDTGYTTNTTNSGDGVDFGDRGVSAPIPSAQTNHIQVSMSMGSNTTTKATMHWLGPLEKIDLDGVNVWTNNA